MTKLNCSVKNCANNNHNYCCISSIYVGGKNADEPEYTDCESFVEKDNGFTNLTVDPNPNVEVGCAAEKCVYNCSHICTADSIKVAGEHAHQAEQTLCATFSEK
ncbi:DUF1540 domain-containing protein [Inconstantimicrobium porci]|uniref:DUF1540 domain-containing protein n=1 Tax=Inconstantimicrobium porci TaxID=2652291 RepID=A0A7X2MWX9_9CLOT|nr:DUF1540 domain-containing protein [Inconstantimicrobium porci]MSR90608.1 DUF1540 domain-containing protein [Inconstantimicrobium porci]